jgi:restriction system protein
MSSPKPPTHTEYYLPTLQALKNLGGSGAIDEINQEVFRLMELSDEVLEIPHGKDGLQSEVEYRLAWTRTYLKKYGVLKNSKRGVWVLIDPNLSLENLSGKKILRAVKDADRKAKEKQKSAKNDDSEVMGEQDAEAWKHELIQALQHMQPDAFERLCQLLLRESGFTQVEVLGKTGDGGIDGKGILKLSGFLSFHVIFQAKRYKGSVGAPSIRDFRGAMQGRADKGLFITTGNFTPAAEQEATRDGAPPIDLIDGEKLCEKLKEFGLGVEVEMIESVSVQPEFFDKV